jgi:hypothetical protein
MLLNTLLLIISSLLAFTNAQCPQFWWPMGYFSSSVNFFTEVMRGNNIAYLDTAPAVDVSPLGHYTTVDRLGATGLGMANSISFLQAAVNHARVPPDFYICGAFTITMWIRVAAAVAGAILDFKDALLANGYLLSLDATGRIPSITPLPAGNGVAAAPGNVLGTVAGLWNFMAITFSGTSGTAPNYFGSTTAAQPSAAQASAVTIAPVPTCNIMTRNYIGNGAVTPISATGGFSGALSDLKIYNFAMSLAQVQTRWTAEVATRATTCSSTSINPQYFYILLVAVLAIIF